MVAAIAPSPIRAGFPSFLDGFAAMHDAMRRDAGRLALALGRVDGHGEARALRRWFGQFHDVIVSHHEREDEILWPALLERSPDFAPLLETLNEDHHALDEAMDALAGALAMFVEGPADELRRADALARALAFGVILDAHLTREEDAAFSRFARLYTAAEYEVLEQQIVKGTPMKHMAFEVPWAFESVEPAKVQEMMHKAPAFVRLLYRYVFVPRYRKVTAPLHDC